MLISEIQPETLTREQLTRFLFDGIQDDGKNGDCIFVFGGKSESRVKKAARLFRDNRAPWVLLTGGSARWENDDTPEAEWMKARIVKLGVPEDALLLEREAANTTENVVASMMVLQRAFGLNRVKRLVVVSSPYHMRRARMTLTTYMPRWVRYSLCPDDRPYGQRYNWWKSQKERERVMKEAASIVKYVRAGILLDEEVEL